MFLFIATIAAVLATGVCFGYSVASPYKTKFGLIVRAANPIVAVVAGVLISKCVEAFIR